MTLRLVPLELEVAQRMVTEHHTHHKKPRGHLFSIGAEHMMTGDLAGAVIVGRPVAQALQDGFTWEVTRLVCRGGAEDKMAASFLLGAAATASFARGIRLLVSYTRKDEDGTCYKAAGWVPVADVKGRPWDGAFGREHRQHYLPGLYEPTTEIVDRIRWEKRPTEAIKAVCKMVYALGQFANAWSRARRRAA